MRAKLGGGAFPASCAQMNASSSTIFGAIPSFENGSIFTLDMKRSSKPSVELPVKMKIVFGGKPGRIEQAQERELSWTRHSVGYKNVTALAGAGRAS